MIFLIIIFQSALNFDTRLRFAVHEVHLWSMVPDEIVATLHVKFLRTEDYFRTEGAIKSFLASKGVTCLTLQPEFDNPSKPNPISFNDSAVDLVDDCR